MLKRTHFSELSISRFTTCKRKHEKSPRLHTPFPNARSEKRKLQGQNDRAATNPTQNSSTYTVVSFQFTTNSIFPVKPMPSGLPKYTWRLKTSLLTLPPLQTVPRRGTHRNLASINFFRTTGAKWRCVRIWLYFFIPKSGRKYSHTNSYNSAMTFISQDDHLTAGAWAVCARTCREKQTLFYTNLNHHED